MKTLLYKGMTNVFGKRSGCLALFLGLLLTVVLIPSANATVVNFDSVDASGGPVSGATLATYLAGYGITYTQGVNDVLQIQQVAPWANTSSNPNSLAITGDRFATFALIFEQPVNSLSFQRMGFDAGNTMAAWTATAYSASNGILGSASEGWTTGTSPLLIQLGGSGIAYVTFVSDHLGWTGSHLQIDDLTFTPAPVPEPGTMLLLGSGLAGLVGYGRRRFKK